MTDPCSKIGEITENKTKVEFIMLDLTEMKCDIKSLYDICTGMDKKIEGMSKFASGAGAVAGLMAGLVMNGVIKLVNVGFAAAATYIR